MSPEAQRIAIAQACGWSVLPREKNAPSWAGLYGYRNRQPSYDVAECPPALIPDYANDLNAMHEAEKTLSHDLLDEKHNSQSLRYITHLVEVTGGFGKPDLMFRQTHATAAQRAEAFLKTIGRWVD